MKKCAFIIPYFGKFHNYFPMFLKSCGYNKEFDWIIFTDDKTDYQYPDNVHVKYMEFSEVFDLVQSKFDFKISLDTPYKLCDYKSAYGFIFEDYLKEYSFWGFCDCDVIFGQLDKFITEDLMNEYDRIFTLGHMSLFRNNFENNRIFQDSYNNEQYYKKVFSYKDIFGFDEMILNKLFEKNEKKIYKDDPTANISVYYYNFHIVKRIYDMSRYIIEDYIPAVYFWENGSIKRLFNSEDDGTCTCNEFPYIHLQHRSMKMVGDILAANIVQIMPNQFIPLKEDSIEKIDINRVKKSSFDRKGYVKCVNSYLRWKTKKQLNVWFPGKFTRGNI